jgi:hypothetical protein
MNYEQFSYSPQDYGTELTANAHQVLYWLNRNGYLDADDTVDLASRMIVVPVRNNKRFGQRLLERFFNKKSTDATYVFPITLLEEHRNNIETNDKPTLKVVK